jgi:adenine deaminase
MADPWVAGLDEVMNRPAWDNPNIPGYNQMWDIIGSTKAAGKLVEGHGSGTVDLAGINEFAAAGLTSDHEVKGGQEVWDKLQRGIFVEMRPASAPAVVPYLIMNGLTNWSNMSVTTDDRSVETSLKLGTMDYNIREAIKAGVPPAWAYVMGSYNTARHYRLDEQIGSIAPGRYADIVLLKDPTTVDIAQVYAAGQLVADSGKTVVKIPTVTWPDWATETMNVGREVTAADFIVPAPSTSTDTVTAYTLKPFYFLSEPMTVTLKVANGQVQRDLQQNVTKFCIVDRYNAQKQPVACMFWQQVGPKTPNTAVCSSVAHDHHNIWVMGSADESMAQCVNNLVKIGGGWTLVSDGQVVDQVVFEVGGLMSARDPQVVADDLIAFWATVEGFDWIGVTATRDDIPAYSAAIQSTVYRQIFATLTCTPWKWVLVAPFKGCPSGFVNVTTGECRAVIK